MERQHIIFNLDDTLVECNKYFDRVIHEFTKEMAGWFSGATEDEIRQRQLEIDLKQVDASGLTTEHFPESFVKTYQYYCQEREMAQDPAIIKHLRELGDSVFHIPIEPLPDMYETLEQLRTAGHELYVHTGGVEANQRRKIAQLQLEAYFDNRVFVSLHKDTRALARIMQEMNFDKRSTWMVGNSPKTDILPALELGINTIYIPAQNEWSYNVVDIDIKPQGAYIQLKALKEVPNAIEGYLDKRDDPPVRREIKSARPR